VALASGTQAIGTLKVGQKVLAYNPKTHTMEAEPIVQVWKHTDDDLVDLTLTVQTHAPHSVVTHRKSEIVHTNKKHPFLTVEHGFLNVASVKVGMHIERADGTVGTVTKWQIVPGIQMMYNLEVAQDHTFTVGVGQWIVHNCDVGNGGKTLYHYTDQKGLNGILKDQAVNPSLNPRFAHYGPGQYLTDVAPEQIGKGGLRTLSVQLYQKGNVAWKLTHYVEINVEGLNIIEGRANVFLVPGDSPLDIAQRIVRFGSTLP